MTTRVLKRMPNGSGIGAGQTATFNLPLGLTYYQLDIRMSGNLGVGVVDIPVANWADAIDEIRLYIDGAEKIRIDAADLASILQYRGQTLQAGVLPIMFANPSQRTPAGEDAPAYGTADVQSMTLEIDIDSGITSPSLTVYGLMGPQTPLGQHYAIKKYPFNVGNTGTRELQDIPRNGYGLLAMHVDTADVSSVELEVNQRIIRDYDRALGSAKGIQTGKVWQSGWTHVDLTESDRLSDMLIMNVEDFRLRLEMTGTGNNNLYTEEIREHQRSA
ncbi:major capsid protein P2 [Thalassospira sp.]|uniref:major capsid protein P2 n=1 Tax=Thalassospira sp. TaxID=1912094 RepID=UPI001B05464C|nr:major capsid protein P2 [Thalassospira sp.]MBO6807246.1 hypothetical protein [Thalassospira sp.]MBO6841653.1 hypothetical protein [Thalassospira sp.]